MTSYLHLEYLAILTVYFLMYKHGPDGNHDDDGDASIAVLITCLQPFKFMTDRVGGMVVLQ